MKVRGLYIFLCLIMLLSFAIAATETKTFTNTQIESNSNTPNRPSSSEYRSDAITANKLCQLMGYDNATTYTTKSFYSPWDNYVYYWSGTQWVKQKARDYNKWIGSLTCIRETCSPNCNGKECGDDGCGGSCGTCVTGEECNNGVCISTDNCRYDDAEGNNIGNVYSPNESSCYSKWDDFGASRPGSKVYYKGELIKTYNSCTDSDGGANVYEIGDAYFNGSGSYDYCSFLNNADGVLMEAVCQDGVPTHIAINCPSNAPYCNRGICSTQAPVCTDSDYGANILEKGTIIEPRMEEGPEYTDYCENINTLQPWESCDGSECGIREYYCETPYRLTTYLDKPCPNGCADGACVEGNECDSDHPCVDELEYCVNGYCEPLGGDPCPCIGYNNGVVSIFQPVGFACVFLGNYSNTCNVNNLISYSCNGGYPNKEEISCSQGCADGACVQENVPEFFLTSEEYKAPFSSSSQLKEICNNDPNKPDTDLEYTFLGSYLSSSDSVDHYPIFQCDSIQVKLPDGSVEKLNRYDTLFFDFYYVSNFVSQGLMDYFANFVPYSERLIFRNGGMLDSGGGDGSMQENQEMPVLCYLEDSICTGESFKSRNLNTCTDLVSFTEDPYSFIDDSQNYWELDWSNSYNSWIYLDNQKYEFTGYSNNFYYENDLSGNNHFWADLNYEMMEFQDVSENTLKDYFDKLVSNQVCVPNDLDSDSGKVYYLCDNNLLWNFDDSYSSANYKSGSIIWLNDNRVFELRVSFSTYYDNYYPNDEVLSRLQEMSYQIEEVRKNQNQLYNTVSQVLDNDPKYVYPGDFYYYLPWDVRIGLIEKDLFLCPSSLEMGEDVCVPSWQCTVEPVVCPEYGSQTRKCVDTRGCLEGTETQVSCNPGMCSGCMLPRWFQHDGLESNNGRIDDICMPYGARFEVLNGWTIGEVAYYDQDKDSITVDEADNMKEIDLDVFENDTAILNWVEFNKSYYLKEGMVVNLDLPFEEFGEVYELTMEVLDIEYNSANPEKSSVSLLFTVNATRLQKTPDYLNMYCDYDGNVKMQKERQYNGDWAKCQNNFECESNVCSSGECIEVQDLLNEVGGFKEIGVRVLCRLADLFSVQDYNSCIVENLGG